MPAKVFPGIFKIEYIKADEVTLYPRQKLSPGSTTSAIGNFTRIPLVGLSSLTYTNEPTDAGTKYNTSLSGTLLDKEDINNAVRANLIEQFHVYRATDIYGNKYLVGIDQEPFPEVVFSQVNDNLPSGLRSVDFQITWQSSIPPVELVIL